MYNDHCSTRTYTHTMLWPMCVRAARSGVHASTGAEQAARVEGVYVLYSAHDGTVFPSAIRPGQHTHTRPSVGPTASSRRLVRVSC